ncbi:hypothetical protein CHS0354_017423 [Potamilus streckersoni]|uniref:Uncharacterized protein n=1 Tax=Potamilus streckersoni TaxID=2493646 RepID=A0AAE0SBZ8_9BIVA|nr:hypothetical protein CHS0354_017423 [Potamilus streckersoni]
MAASWGKRAANRIDRTQFEKDELLKSLGSQFNVDFADYDKWTRKTVRRPVAPKQAADDSFKFDLVGPGPSQRIFSADSCRHGAGLGLSFREKRMAIKQQEQDKEKAERLKILELRIRTRRRTLIEYEKRAAELLEKNITLKGSIDQHEHQTLDQVKGLLRKYEKYRGGITTLNSHFQKEYEAAKTELQETKKRIGARLHELENKVADLDQQLKVKQDELHILMSYKDKEYPVKAMKISNLQKETQTLKISNEEDQEELEHIIKTELGKYEKERTVSTNQIVRSITEKAISMMHPSLKDMALQNMVMQKEIEFHRKEQEELEIANQELETEVTKLLHDPKTNTRFQMFPEFFPSQQKCTPDMDVVLDIPTQEWLPI